MHKVVGAGGLEVGYTDVGAGPPIVLLHGGLTTGELQWSAHLTRLASGHRVLVPDARGHGATGNPSGELSYPLLGDDCAAFVAALGLERPLVVGYSDGAQAALELALRHPDAAGALVLGGVMIEPDAQYLRFVDRLGMGVPGEVDEERLATVLAGYYEENRAAHGAQWPQLLRATSWMWHGLRRYRDEELAAITVATLVVAGQHDEPAATQAVRLCTAVTGAELAIVPGAGHEAVARDLFAELVLDFAGRRLRPAPIVVERLE